MEKTKYAVRYHEFGKPNEVLIREEIPREALEAEKARVRLLASPINPSDIGSILGKYGKHKELPATAGMEGIGEVVEVGAEVDSLKPGDTVRIPEEVGTWQESCIALARSLHRIPDGLPVETACMGSVNPQTAICLVDEFIDLRAGDWIIQNGANSNVGVAVIQYARSKGIRTVNVVRRESLRAPLIGLGADVVVTEDEPYSRGMRDLTGGGEVRLGLNSIGGQSALNLLDALSTGGVHVTFGAMTFEPIRFPTRQLIFNAVNITGFWLHKWKSDHGEEATRVLDDRVYSLIVDGTFQFPVAGKYSLADFHAALEHQRNPRFGKVLFVSS